MRFTSVSKDADFRIKLYLSEFVLQGKSKQDAPRPNTMRSVTLFH